MPVVTSPGVYSREVDFSLYVPQLAQSIFGVVGTASKGPTDEITLITDEATLIETFGRPASDHLGLYCAIRYLRKGKQLKFVRVAHYDASATNVIPNSGGSVTAVTVTAVSSGSWGNNISLIVSNGSGVDPATGDATYKITVRESGATVEVFDLLLIGDSYTSQDNYISTRINGVSDYISVAPVSGQTSMEVSSTAITLAGGDDGAPATVSDYIGTAAQSSSIPATGLQLFTDAENVDVNILAVPDISHRTIISELISICEARKDSIALIDVPYGKSVQQAVAWANGLGGGATDPTAAINSSYAAIYYPWVQVYDGYNDANTWIPPSGHAAGAMAYTDNVAESWWAPAGLQRAVLTDVLEVEHSATQGERDYMYSNGNVLNPIIDYPSQGIVIWGQRTATRTSSALDRINVRRMMLYLEKAVTVAVRPLVFQPNDEETWADFRNLVEPICEDIKARRGLYDYSVVCDDTTNTAAVINQNQMKAKVLVQPTKTAEMITIDFTLLNNEAQFSEF